MKKIFSNHEGVILVEIVVSICLMGMILTCFIPFITKGISQSKNEIYKLSVYENLCLMRSYIEKTLKECEEQTITYDPTKKTLQGRYNGQSIRMDFSGKKSNVKGTLLYYYKNSKQLRTNKNREHNILMEHVKDVTIRAIIPKKLIEITIVSEYDSQRIKILYALKEGMYHEKIN